MESKTSKYSGYKVCFWAEAMKFILSYKAALKDGSDNKNRRFN